MGIFKRRKEKDKQNEEVAVTSVVPAKEQGEERQSVEEFIDSKQQEKKKPNMKQIVGTVVDVIDVGKDAYKKWVDPIIMNYIKPIFDNRAHIKRRWGMLVTTISVIFFLLYVPILLFSKIAKGLSLGWDIALYVCIGVFVASVIVMVIILTISGRSTNTKTAKRCRKASSIILFVVRIASVALSITAICISGNGKSSALDTILLVLAIVSIVFTAISLIFGGIVGFFKWLISPPKIKYRFSLVALEWKQRVDEGKREQSKAVKRSYYKNRDKVEACLDNYLLPTFGKTYINLIDGEKLMAMMDNIPEEDKNLTEWIVKEIFSYAKTCGYLSADPCDGLALEGDVLQEKPPKQENDNVLGRLASFFKKKNSAKDDNVEDI